MATTAEGSGRTFVERARRAQLIEVTIALVAERGYAATTLASIAQAAGITKGAVLYHFATKEAVVAAAYESVLQALVNHVGEAVEAAPVARRPQAYVRGMIEHLRTHPQHTRMLTQALTVVAEPASSRERWAALERLIVAAREAMSLRTAIDTRSLAIAVGGAIDGIVTERLADPDYDTQAAAEVLVLMLDGVLLSA